MDVFQIDSGDWIQQATSETPALGVSGYSCTAVGDSLYYFGGSCGHDGCYHNSMHKLSTSSLQWMMLSPSTSKSGAPMRKMDCGMVAFRDGEEDILCVVAGWGPTPSYRQPGAQYEADGTGYTSCNENHMFNLSTSEFSVLDYNFHKFGVFWCIREIHDGLLCKISLLVLHIHVGDLPGSLPLNHALSCL